MPFGVAASCGSFHMPFQRAPVWISKRMRPFPVIHPQCSTSSARFWRGFFAGRFAAVPAAWPRQCARTGHSPQRGERGTQRIAPSSMSAPLKSPGLFFGTSRVASDQRAAWPLVESIGSRKSSSRDSTRATFASTRGSGRSNAKLATAPAVYRPTPGSARIAAASAGREPPCSATTLCAARCKFRARL